MTVSTASTGSARGRSVARGGRLLTHLLLIGVIIALVWEGSAVLNRNREIHAAQENQTKLFQEYDFDPGYIISDRSFFDSDALTSSQIQRFFDKVNSGCSGDFCLKSYKFKTDKVGADGLCKGFSGGQDQTAAAIIDGSARSCGISQKVLLVMLQKEQGLVTAKSVDRTQVNSAMGLSCPDNGPCDQDYLGFFKQVYGAAKRFKYYQAHASRYPYKPASLAEVRYNPAPSCGSSRVYIRNQATALLYTYTPYQPNEAALKAGDGQGDSCSTYGNRNFAFYYCYWFGSPFL